MSISKASYQPYCNEKNTLLHFKFWSHSRVRGSGRFYSIWNALVEHPPCWWCFIGPSIGSSGSQCILSRKRFDPDSFSTLYGTEWKNQTCSWSEHELPLRRVLIWPRIVTYLSTTLARVIYNGQTSIKLGMFVTVQPPSLHLVLQRMPQKALCVLCVKICMASMSMVTDLLWHWIIPCHVQFWQKNEVVVDSWGENVTISVLQSIRESVSLG